jgi:hypothetical protein
VYALTVQSQSSWKLVKNKDGINVYLSSGENSKFKSIRVQTVFDGTIQKLIAIVGDISKHPQWVYKAKSAYILKQVSPYEFLYYIESIVPWPMSNRDAVIHLTMVPDSAHHTLRINANSEPDFIAKKSGLVRIPFSKGSWFVTESANKINIDYTFQVDPGGSIPAWLVNMLADKGPYESFQKLKAKLIE